MYKYSTREEACLVIQGTHLNIQFPYFLLTHYSAHFECLACCILMSITNSTVPNTKARAFFAMNTEDSYLCICQITARMTRNGRLIAIVSKKPRMIDTRVLSLTSPFSPNLFQTRPSDERRKLKQVKKMMDNSVAEFKSNFPPSVCFR